MQFNFAASLMSLDAIESGLRLHCQELSRWLTCLSAETGHGLTLEYYGPAIDLDSSRLGTCLARLAEAR